MNEFDWSKEKNLKRFIHYSKNPKLFLLKQFIIHLPLPEIKIPKTLKTNEALIFRNIRDNFLKHQKLQEEGFLKRYPEQKSNKPPFEQLYKKTNFVFNSAIILTEADGFYRHRFMDLYYAIAWTHDQNKKVLGPDYLDNYFKQRKQQSEEAYKKRYPDRSF